MTCDPRICLLRGTPPNKAVPLGCLEFTNHTAMADKPIDMESEIAALEGKLSKAPKVKQGMMSVLLMEKVRLV